MLGPGDFAGRWRLTRAIDDRLSGQQGHLTGEARFAGQGAELVYDEVGQFQMGASPAMTAERRYLWHFTDTRVEVSFADGAQFHSFVADGLGDGTDHPCGADFYQVRYDFRSWPNWQAVWTVRGPRKDYTARSDYSPLEP